MDMHRFELLDLDHLVQRLNETMAVSEPTIEKGDFHLRRGEQPPASTHDGVDSKGTLNLVQKIPELSFDAAGQPKYAPPRVFGHVHVRTGYQNTRGEEPYRREIAELITRYPLRFKDGQTLPVSKIRLTAGINDLLNVYAFREGYIPAARFFWKRAELMLVPADWFLKESIKLIPKGDARAAYNPDIAPG